MGMATKAGLIGRWRIVRRIDDRLGAPALFEGQGVFTAQGAGLLWKEKGQIRIGDAPPLMASRQYLWRFTKNAVFIDYGDGAPFHSFGTGQPLATHLCGQDTYDVEYAFDLPLHWTAVWTVTGPRKNYVSNSEMTRQ